MENLGIKKLIEWEGAAGKKRIERLLAINPAGDQFFFIPVLGKKAWPFDRSFDQVKSAFDNGIARVVEQRDCSEEVRLHLEVISEENLSVTQRELRDKAWSAVEKLVLDEKLWVFDSRRGGKLIRRWAKLKELNRSTLYKYLRRCWQRGITRDAVQPDLRKCGGRGSRHKRGAVKLGRPKVEKLDKKNQVIPVHPGINISAQDEANFKTALDKYFVGKHLKLGTTFRYMQRDYYSILRPGDHAVDFYDLKPVEESPTYMQFFHYFKTHYPKTRGDLLKEREGELTYARKFRAVVGAAPRKAAYPGAVYQIDSTVLDLNVVHSLYPEIVIGRPTLYWVIDVFTTMITGFYLGFENAAYNTAMLALWNAFRDKVELCKEYNVTITEANWPAKGLPGKLLADRGEMLSLNADALANLGVDVSNTPPYRADLKGLVERHFKLINERAIHDFPGAVDQSGDPSKPDERRKAVLDIHRLTRIILLLIWDYNRSLRPDYPLTSDMVIAGIEPRPINIWNWGMQKMTGMLQHMDPCFVQVALLPSAEASLTGKGIVLEQLHYSRPELMSRFEKARTDGSEKVRVHYDPFLVDTIFLIGRSADDLQACTLTDRSDHHLGRSWLEYRRWKANKPGNSDVAKTAEMQRHNDIDALAKKELADAKAAQDGGRVTLKKLRPGKEDQQTIERVLANQTKAALHGLREAPVDGAGVADVSEHEKKACEFLDQLDVNNSDEKKAA